MRSFSPHIAREMNPAVGLMNFSTSTAQAGVDVRAGATDFTRYPAGPPAQASRRRRIALGEVAPPVAELLQVPAVGDRPGEVGEARLQNLRHGSRTQQLQAKATKPADV